MKLNWKFALVCVSSVALLGAGCSGINASHSVSPATFLLPGLMKNEPLPVDSTDPLLPVTPGVLVAQTR